MTRNESDSGDPPDHDETPSIDAGISPDDPLDPVMGLQEEAAPVADDGTIQGPSPATSAGRPDNGTGPES